MSTGVFLSIQQSYVPAARADAIRLGSAVNRALAALGLPELHDVERGPRVCEGRTALDHRSSSWIAKLGELAGKDRGHAHLLSLNPYRLATRRATSSSPR